MLATIDHWGRRLALALCWLFGAAVLGLCAEESRSVPTVVMAAPGNGTGFDWPVITADRSGLYSRVYEEIFTAAGLRLVQMSLPNLRCKWMVKQGQADFYPGDVQGDSFEGYAFLTPRYAIWHTQGEAVLFKKSAIPKWEGVQSLKGKQLLYHLNHITALEQHQALLADEIKHAYSNQKPDAALLMLINGRADVLLSSIELIRTAEAKLNIKLAPEEYQIEYLGRKKYYPQFQNNERGRRLADIFDNGMLRLYRSGRLNAWYQDPASNASIDNIDPALASAAQKTGLSR